MDGFLLVNKPKGITSFGAVYKVRKIVTDKNPSIWLIIHANLI
jgi:tRNA U55 pseudouridine synthase TruB